jgi:hypothetical protein
MTEYVSVRASETLDQTELVRFLKSRFAQLTRPVGRTVIQGTECVETRVPSNSAEFDEICNFIVTKRRQGQPAYCDFSIGNYLRKYTKEELRSAELLRLIIDSQFKPSGEECGTVYEGLCEHCNHGRQASDLILDLRRVPQHKDLSETISWVEWVVSERFVTICKEKGLSGAEFRPIYEFKNPTQRSNKWQQVWVTGKAGELSPETELLRDPFSPPGPTWSCPRGHSVVTQFKSEMYIRKSSWDGADISITTSLFGQGRNLLRPTPFIFVSRRMYGALEESALQGFSFEVAHLV